MAMASTAAKRWTVELLDTLPDDGNRYELVDGELLVTPAPAYRHQDAATELASLLRGYAKRYRLAAVLAAPADVEYSRHTRVQPDILAVPLKGGKTPRDFAEARHLLLAVEILSPSSVRADQLVKRRLYQRQQVPQYWIIAVSYTHLTLPTNREV